MFSAWRHALGFAAARHGDQSRKGSGAPYLIHPIGVSELCFVFYPEDHVLAVAGLLHDLIEDTKTTADEIEEHFGREVRDLVVGVTSERGKDWHDTRARVIERLKTADERVVRLKGCDALHNATAMVRDISIRGDEFWSMFKTDPMDILGYYMALDDVVYGRLGAVPLSFMLHDAVMNLKAFVEGPEK